jgi:hypothetical protein
MLTVDASVADVSDGADLRLLVGDALPGTLDLSFGGNGKFVTTLRAPRSSNAASRLASAASSSPA